MMNKAAHIASLALAVFCMSSCLKEKREATYNTQEDKIDKYVSSNMYRKYTEDGESKTDTLRIEYRGGSTRLVTKEGTGEMLKKDGTVSFYCAGYTFTGSKSYSSMFFTNHKETAEAAKWELSDSDFELKLVNLAEDALLEGLKDGLTGVKSGEQCQILFSGKHGFGKKPFGIIPAESALLFEIWVEGVSNE